MYRPTVNFATCIHAFSGDEAKLLFISRLLSLVLINRRFYLNRHYGSRHVNRGLRAQTFRWRRRDEPQQFTRPIPQWRCKSTTRLLAQIIRKNITCGYSHSIFFWRKTIENPLAPPENFATATSAIRNNTLRLTSTRSTI